MKINNVNKDTLYKKDKINLIALPYAGGSSNYFESIRKALTNSNQNIDIQMIEVVLPGRAFRYHEPLLTNIDDLVSDVWQQIKHLLHQTFAIFGHSMGSLLAYLLCHKIKENGYSLPKHLFLSGREAPSTPPDFENAHLLPLQAFKNKLKGYNPISPEILNNQEFFSFFEPILRADFEAIETWKYHVRPKLNINTTVFSGTEEDMTTEELETWQQEFYPNVQFYQFNGGHFFINDHASSIVEIISRKIETVSVLA